MYYRVVRGKKTGVFTNEEEAQKQIEGYVGGEYIVFSTKEEAVNYLNPISFQDIKINFEKASKKIIFNEFKTMEELKKHEYYVHKNSMETSLNWISDYQEIVNSTSKENSKLEAHNIFSIVGDRGTGKSSFMETLRNSIESGIYKDDNKSGQNDIFALPIIDPNIFDNTISLIEFLISTLKSQVDCIKHKNSSSNNFNNCFNGETNTFVFQKFNNELRDIIEILKSMRIDKSEFAESKSGPEVLENINDKNNFREKIENLINIFLEIVNLDNDKKKYTQISILLDDLDLVRNKDVYSTLQDCFKFLLHQRKVIMFISYREKQLSNSVLDYLVGQNKNLLHRDLLDEKIITVDDLREQTANFLEKGLPRQKRVYLLITKNTPIYSILYPFVDKENLREIKYLKQVYLEEFLHDELMKQTRLSITPVDGAELTHFIFPKTLRSVMQYLELIHSFDNYQKAIINKNKYLSLSYLRRNIKKYKYFFISLLQDSLPENYFNVVDEFFKIDSYYKNHFISNALLKKVVDFGSIRGMEERIDYLLNKEVYNVSLGDVFESMYYFKNNNNTEISNYFIYSLKLIYSIDMLLMLSKSLMMYNEVMTKETTFYESLVGLSIDDIENNIELIQLDKYLHLNRGKVMPDDFYYNRYIPLEVSSRNKNPFIDKFYRLPTDSEGNRLYKEYLFYGNIASLGDTQKNTKKNKSFTKNTFFPQFREMFLKSNFITTNSYNIDLYSCLSDSNHVLESVKEILQEKENIYIFYSMFDIDIFFRKNYSRQSPENEAELIIYSLERVNNIFINKLQTPIEQFNRMSLSFPLFESNYNRSNFKFKPIIPNELMDWITESYEPTSPPIDEVVDSILRVSMEKFIEDYADLAEAPAYEIKNFLKNYKSIYSDWPEIADLDNNRLNSLVIDGNRKRINDNDKHMVQLLIDDHRDRNE